MADLEDLGGPAKRPDSKADADSAPISSAGGNERKQMLSPPLRAALGKQGYKLIGGASSSISSTGLQAHSLGLQAVTLSASSAFFQHEAGTGAPPYIKHATGQVDSQKCSLASELLHVMCPTLDGPHKLLTQH